MATKVKTKTVRRSVSVREGYQGKPLPAGVVATPPKGPAAGVPVPSSKKSK